MKYYDLSFSPTENDYVIQSNGFKYGLSEGINFLGDYDTVDEALGAIKERMGKSSFYPNIFFVSDHGNMWQIDEDGAEIKEGEAVI